MNCRFCQSKLELEFVDLISSPLSNSYLLPEQVSMPETYYPLKLYTCTNCYLVQIDEYKKAIEIFDKDYAYFSSFSLSWLAHCKKYSDLVSSRFNLNSNSLVIEIASNDGYLLQYFKENNIPVLGIEPTENTASVAITKGIECIVDFFGVKLARMLEEKGRKADLIAGNNVLAHVPDLNDFVEGLKIALKPQGVITMEFPHLMQMVEKNQFDTIYHEHFSYLSFTTVKKIFEAHQLQMFDVEEIPTHGGSLRIYAKHKDDQTKVISAQVEDLLQKEKAKGMTSREYYLDFTKKVSSIKNGVLKFLLECNANNKSVIAYGAAAKGNTLLNYCGVKKDFIQYVVDASPYKQGKYMPGSHIPIVNESKIRESKPDYVLILPWNIKNEITEQLSYIREWEGKFVIPIPTLEIS